jgi:peptidoglycan/LPS O-acetylase OafA/YrhL
MDNQRTVFSYPRYFDFALTARGIAALLVVFWHAGGNVSTSNAASYLVMPGRTAVWVFFSLSGFLISYGFIHDRYVFRFGSIAHFYVNRFLRIYPLFLFVSAVSYVGFAMLGRAPGPQSLHFISSNFLMLQWDHSYPLNGAFWTLGIEAQLYALFPLILFVQLRGKNIYASVLLYFALVLMLFYLRRFDSTLLSDCRNLLGNLMHFQLGVAVCAAHNVIQKFLGRVGPMALSTMAAAVAALLLVSDRLYRTDNGAFLSWEGIALVDGMMVLVLSMHTVLSAKRIPMGVFLRSLTVLGTLSYGLYAWHPVVQNFTPRLASNEVYVIAASYLLAVITYIAIEKPLLSMKSYGQSQPPRIPGSANPTR